ncbi:MAG: phosphate acetyltransferase [Pseudomonadota bacterium]
MKVLQELRARAADRPGHIVLSEGEDARIVAGALNALRNGIAQVTLLGAPDKVRSHLKSLGCATSDDINIEDPKTSPRAEEFAQAYFDLRKHKGISEETAAVQARNPLIFAAMMVRNNYAAGTVGGAVATTSETVRAALQIIGKAPDAPIVSSFFLMALPEDHPSGRKAMVFSDCGLVIDPDADELAAIAAASAHSYQQLVGDAPKLAFLSFSTMGSARHAAVTKVTDALALFKSKQSDIAADGELQFDAAFVPAVAATKAPESSVGGSANVMIFPNLDAGNIGYKIAQRMGGAQAIGPVLQGLAKPANDLSRGCVADDVTNMIAVTVLQSNHP